jgi:hypothetical protein
LEQLFPRSHTMYTVPELVVMNSFATLDDYRALFRCKLDALLCGRLMADALPLVHHIDYDASTVDWLARVASTHSTRARMGRLAQELFDDHIYIPLQWFAVANAPSAESPCLEPSISISLDSSASIEFQYHCQL